MEERVGGTARICGGVFALILCAVLSLPATATAAVGDLSFVGAEFDGLGGIDGLDGASDAVVSPDGRHVYVASVTDGAISGFERDPVTGGLSYLGVWKDGIGGVEGLGGVRRLAISPDGKHVYAPGSSDDTVAIFLRGNNGLLSFVGCVEDAGSPAACDDQGGQIDGLDRALGVGVSPDGKHVYVAAEFDSAVTVFSRNQGSGALQFVETQRQGVGGVDGLSGAVGVAVAPDGGDVYSASYSGSAVSVFSRNAQSGALTFVESHEDGVDGVDGLAGGDGPELSPDGRLLYATGDSDDSVATFTRNPANGRLAFQGAVFDEVGGVDGLDGATLIAISPDGRNLYAPGEFDSALAGFSINPASGLLSFVEAFFDTSGGIPDGIGGAEGVAVSPDGANVYVPGRNDDGVGIFARERDTTLDGSVTARKKQKQRGKKIIVKAKVEADEDLTAEAGGKVKVGRKSYKLKSQTKGIGSGESKNLKLKPKKAKDAKKIAKALKKGKKAKAKLKVELADDAGNAETTKLSVKLKR